MSNARFAEYLRFAETYAPEAATAAEWRAVRYLRSDGLFSSSASTVNEEAITILGVNTALLAQGDDIGKLAVGLRAWRTLGIQSRTRRNFTFLLSHHPLENVANQQWLCEREVNQGSQMTRSSDVSLSGHVHKADAQRVTSLDGASLRLVAGAVHDDLPDFVEGIPIPQSHAYTLSTLVGQPRDGH